MHLWADRVIFEVYDPTTGSISPTGAGQLVVTVLGREAMPLLRYNLEDDVDVSTEPCPCGWRLPTVRIYGRTRFAHPVGATTVTAAQLEHIIFSLPRELDVVFWRAKADRDRLRVEIEAPVEHRDAARDLLIEAIADQLGVATEVAALRPGTLVPREVLTGKAELVKPRSLFGADEDWDRALLYF